MNTTTSTDPAAHKIMWWVYAGSERIRRESTMRGQWGYDATCSCGWDSRTGGGVQSWVRESVADHKSSVAWDAANGTDLRMIGVWS